MLKGIKPGEFLDEYQEWHAMVIGFCEVLCPWPQQHPTLNVELNTTLWDEHHYYMLGRALGVFAWLGIAAAVKAVFF